MVAILLAALCAPCANATPTYTYTYTGSDFDWFGTDDEYGFTSGEAPWTADDSILGQFTVSDPLAADMVLQAIYPTWFSFSDGIETYSSGDDFLQEPILEVSTDSQGQIDAWYIELFTPGAPDDSWQYWMVMDNSGDIGCCGDWAALDLGDGGLWFTEAQAYPPGTWTSGEETTIPEPSSVVLMSTALLALAFAARRRTAPGRPRSGTNRTLRLRWSTSLSPKATC